LNRSNSIIIGSSIVLGFIILGCFVMLTFGGKSSTVATDSGNVGTDASRYEMVTANQNNIIIFDKQSGEYWRKFIDGSAGPTEWTKEPSPVSNAK
jgi:hypothetical protein